MKITTQKKFAAVAVITLAMPAGVLLWTTTAGASDNPASTDDLASPCVQATPLTAQEIAEINAKQDALAAYLKAHGVAHTVETEDDGTRWADWDYDDDAANKAVDAFYAETYPLSPEEIKEIDADEDALAAYLKAHGIAFTVEAQVDGTHIVVWDEDDEKANAAVDAFYGTEEPDESDGSDGVTADGGTDAATVDASFADIPAGTGTDSGELLAC